MQGNELATEENTEPVQVPVPVNPKPKSKPKEREVKPEPITVIVRQRDWNPDDENEMVEDEVVQPKRKEPKGAPALHVLGS